MGFDSPIFPIYQVPTSMVKTSKLGVWCTTEMTYNAWLVAGRTPVGELNSNSNTIAFWNSAMPFSGQIIVQRSKDVNFTNI